jgi:uncharacterized protein with PIN domain
MLGSLARKLRLYGFDSVYVKDAQDDELLLSAAREGRILLTSDRALVEKAKRSGVAVLLLPGQGDLANMSAVATSTGANFSLDPRRSRCAVCNGILSAASKDEVRSRVPEGVLDRQYIFYTCEMCGKAYWEGGHWRKLTTFDRQLKKMLRDE